MQPVYAYLKRTISAEMHCQEGTQMDEATRAYLLETNEKLIKMVIERAKRDFPEDIALIGLTGSFSTGDYHERSDLDLIIINNTDRGWEIASCFILGEIGYDIYCTPWDTRINDQANLVSPMVSCLVDLQILYSAKPEYLERFNQYRQLALDTLALPSGEPCLNRARDSIQQAKQYYADAMLAEEPSAVRFAAGLGMQELIHAVTHLNNTYFKRGLKRYWEEMATWQNLPDDFEAQCHRLVATTEPDDVRSIFRTLLENVIRLHARLKREWIPLSPPTSDNLAGTYEELWCNFRNKLHVCAETGNQTQAWQVALGAQGFFDEMSESRGTPRVDVVGAFHAEDLPGFRDAFMQMMEAYRTEYDKAGRAVERYATFEDLYAHFMREMS